MACKACEGTGYVVVGLGLEMSVQGLAATRTLTRCLCEGGPTADLLRRAKVPKRLRTIATAPDSLTSAVAAKAAEISAHLRQGRSVAIVGPPGRGKSVAAPAAALQAKVAHKMRYKSMPEFLSELRDAYGRDWPEADITEPLLDVDLLLLDDLGAEGCRRGDAGAWVRTIIYLILNGRELKDKPTIVVSNLPLDALGQEYGDRIASRLSSYHRVVFPPSMPDLRKL